MEYTELQSIKYCKAPVSITRILDYTGSITSDWGVFKIKGSTLLSWECQMLP